MTLSEKEFKADRLNVKHLKLNGIDISNFQIETLGDGKYIDSMRGDIQVNITPSMLNANGEYVIEQLPGLGRFKKVEVSMVSKPVYYLAPNGLDTNLGTKDSPWQTLSNVPNNSIVVLLNGTYTSSKFFDGNSKYSCMMCFYTPIVKTGLIIISESKTGVIINRYDTNGSYDYEPFICDKIDGAHFINMNFNVKNSRGINGNIQFYISTSTVTFHNMTLTMNIKSPSYTNDYYNLGDCTYNMCTVVGGTIQYNSSTVTVNNSLLIPYVGLNNSNIGLNGTIGVMSNLDAKNIFFTYLVNDFVSSNTLTFKTNKTNFNTITLNLWLEQ